MHFIFEQDSFILRRMFLLTTPCNVVKKNFILRLTCSYFYLVLCPALKRGVWGLNEDITESADSPVNLGLPPQTWPNFSNSHASLLWPSALSDKKCCKKYVDIIVCSYLLDCKMVFMVTLRRFHGCDINKSELLTT